MTFAQQKRLLGLKQPASGREQRMLAYRAELMRHAWQLLEPLPNMKVTELVRMHPDIEERYQTVMQRVILISCEIEKEREARGIFFDPTAPVTVELPL